MTGVELDDGRTIACDIVISNCDVQRTYTDLVATPAALAEQRKIAAHYEPACSGVVLYLGLKRRYQHLRHNCFLFSGDSKQEFDDIYRKGEPARDPTLYLCVPSASDPTQAPAGGESLYILVHTPYRRDHHDWDTPGGLFDQYRRVIIDKLKRTGGMPDIEERIVKVGNEAIVEADVRGVHPKIVEALGKMHFRTSYGQNVLRHSIEVAFLAQMIADQLGLNGAIARRAGLLHDIGKAMDHEMEGGHPAIGMEFLRKFGEKSEAVLNACGGHHGDIPSTTAYTPIIMAADAISGARPGARRESMELYIKRLEQLEAIAREQPFVDEAHAIQAGREIRVILNAKKADDTQAFQIAEAIARRVEAEMTFPGEIKVTVLRETRAEAIAR